MSTVTGRLAASFPTTGPRRGISPTESQSTAQRTARQATARQDADHQSTAEADGLAVASFLLGLPGLLLFNIVLGPIAIALATLALVRGTSRRGRALLGLILGIASLVILAVTLVTSHGVLIDIGS